LGILPIFHVSPLLSSGALVSLNGDPYLPIFKRKCHVVDQSTITAGKAQDLAWLDSDSFTVDQNWVFRHL
jgi:hypothetical protein